MSTLKELTEKYTTADIISEASLKYTLFHEDFMSLSYLIETIRNSPKTNTGGMDIVPMIAFLGKGKNTKLISYGGFQKDNRHYRFTEKNCGNKEKLSCCKVRIPDRIEHPESSLATWYLPETELEFLTIILFSINAFSPEVVDCYFDGDAKNANPIAYIVELIKNNDSPINKF